MSLIAKFPKDLLSFLQKLEKAGARFCLVGGAPRDFLLNGSLVTDLDFEYRLDSEKKSFADILKAHNLVFETLPYDIYRFDFEEYSLEFSRARIEEILTDNKSHHHFTPQFSNHYSYKESFKRRDLTINAIGIELNLKEERETIIDPYFGVADLRQRLLKEVSEDFFYDHVRLFRLIRFKLKFQYEVDLSIMNALDRFDLGFISYFHLKQEMEKSRNVGEFLALLKAFTSNNKTLTVELKELLNLDFSKKIENLTELIEFLISKRHLSLAHFLIGQFHLKKASYATLFSFVENYDYLLKNPNQYESLEFKKALKYYLEHPSELKTLGFSEIYPFDLFATISNEKEELLKLPVEKRAFYKIDQYIDLLLKNSKIVE